MDVIKFSDSGGLPIHQGIYGEDEEAGPSMEAIILSMRSHLLVQAGTDSMPPPPPGTSDSETRTEFHSSDDRMMEYGNTTPKSRHGAGGVTSAHNMDNNKQMETTPERRIPNGVPPLDLTCDSETDFEVDLSENPELHPRLNTPFYEQLRMKYPRAFRRRHSSTGSEQSSMCGDTPRSARPPRTSSVQPRTEPRKGGSLPPKPPMSFTRKGNHSGVEIVPAREKEDMTITGCSPRRRSVKTPDHGGDGVHGILKKDLNSGSTVSLKRSDSMESVKDKLRKNSQSLKSLLSDENSPFRSNRTRRTKPNLRNVTRVASQDNTSSTSSEFTLQSPLQKIIKPIPKPSIGINITQNKILQNHSPNVQHRHTQKRARVDDAKHKHVGSKRLASPDSPGDSAVDMDTASVHSSPSSDTQPNSIPPTAFTKPLEINPALSPGQGFLPPGQGFVNAVADMQLHMARQVGVANSQDDIMRETLSDMDIPAYSGFHNRDSDVDSGIAHPYMYVNTRHGRNGSVSSLEMEHDADLVYRTYGFHGGPPSISSRDLRLNPHDASSAAHGPVRANHNIALVSPRHQSRDSSESEMETWNRQGARPKMRRPPSAHSRRAASVTDLARQRASPTNRVHFEDEVYGGFGLSPHQRTQSQPDLSKQGALPPPGRKLRTKQMSGSRGRINGHAGPRLHDRSSPALVPSESEEELARYALPSGVRFAQDSEGHELQKRVHKSRSRSTTPLEAALSTSDEDLESTLQVHRASPAIVVPSTSVLPNQSSSLPQSRNSTPTSDILLAHEMALFSNEIYQDHNVEKPKKSKKFWKRNKGRYTPSEEIEKVQQQMMQDRTLSQSMQNISRPSSARSDVISSKPPIAKRPPRPASATGATINNKRNSHQNQYNDRTYENVGGNESIHDEELDHENPYEAIDVMQMHQKAGPGSVSSVDSGVHDHGPERVKSQKVASRQVKSKKKDYNPDGVIYSQVVRKTKEGTLRPASSNPCIVSSVDETITSEQMPPVPKRGYKSDLEKHKDLSGSRTSLSEKAKKGFGRLKRAFSLDRIDRAGENDKAESDINSTPAPGTLKKSPSLQSLGERLSFRKKSRSKEDVRSIDSSPRTTRKSKRPPVAPMRRKHSTSMSALDSVDTPKNFRCIGKLVKLNSDGSQVLELTKPPHGPFGFYIARGSAKYKHGIFISRLSDGLPEKFFAGLLGLGDEILEINQQSVQNMSLEAVYDMMGDHAKLLLKTLPFMARQDS